MNRQEKQDSLDQLSGMYSENQFIFLVSMNGVNAENALSFRAEVRKNNAQAVVAKNTLNKIVAKNIGLDAISQYFSKQVLTIFTNDPVEVAKILKKYEEKGYSVVAGSDKSTILSSADVKKLATVPTLPVLRSMLLSSILGVHTKIVRVLSERAKALTVHSNN